jgi:hypothetical protein
MVRQTVIPKTYSIKTYAYIVGVLVALNGIEPKKADVYTPSVTAVEVEELSLSLIEQIEQEQEAYLDALEKRDMVTNYGLVDKAVSDAINYLNAKHLGGEQFLKEIAMAESRLGTHPNTIRTSGNAGRGIWQIDRIGFEETKNVSSHPILKEYHKNLKRVGIDWEKVTWDDCNKPLYGAIAARLLLVCKPFKIAENRAKRAVQWKKHYNSFAGKGTPEHYWETVKECYAQLNKTDRYPNMDYWKYIRNI